MDQKSTVRIGSHIRLRAAQLPTNDSPNVTVERRPIVDGVVSQSDRGELRVDLMDYLPHEFEEMGWLMYDAGTVTTSQAMMDALKRLGEEPETSCSLYRTIVGMEHPAMAAPAPGLVQITSEHAYFNASQRAAIQSSTMPFSLVWGPPGTSLN